MIEHTFLDHPDLVEAFSDIDALECFDLFINDLIHASSQKIRENIGHLKDVDEYLFHGWRDPIDPVAVFTHDRKLFPY